MNWKEILLDKGFTWNEHSEVYQKSLGFGQKITVEMFMKGLFTIHNSKGLVFDGFIKSKKEFIEIVGSL